MVQNTSLIAGIFLLLVGCISLDPVSSAPQDIASDKPYYEKPQPELNGKFSLRGRVFSISADGQIYFVDFKDQSIVRKANLQNHTLIDSFIDLKEWLKTEVPEKLQIDDLWIDLEGRLILAESKTGKILRISKDARKLENLADSYDGFRLSRIQGLMGSRNGELFIGSPNTATIYQFDTKSGKLLVLNENLIRPEDFATSSAGDRLLVAESWPNRIVVYDVNTSSPMRRSWDLIKFTKPQERPLSIDFLDQESEVFAVLTARGKKLQIFNLSKGKLVQEIDLQVPCLRVRAYDEWIYLQTRKGIIRTKIPSNLKLL